MNTPSSKYPGNTSQGMAEDLCITVCVMLFNTFLVIKLFLPICVKRNRNYLNISTIYLWKCFYMFQTFTFFMQTGTMRLIYAFNPNDPSSDSSPLAQHTVRGSKSVQLLSPPREEPSLPPDAFPYDIVMFSVRFIYYLISCICNL